MPNAIFGGRDAIALGCMDILSARGLRVPADVSVVGFDDTMLARSAHLSTVRQPLRGVGKRAVQFVGAQVEAKLQDTPWKGPKNIVSPTEIIEAQTLAKPRAKKL